MAGEIGLRALAARAAEPARAGVRGGDEHEARREDHDLLAADDRHVAVLERLAERLEARARELRELVQEEHAAVRQRRLARLRRVRAADEAGGGDRVVRRAERARGDEAGRAAQAGDRLDARDLDRLLGRRAAAGSTAAAARSSSCRCRAGPAGTGCGRPPRRPRARGSARCGRGRRRAPASGSATSGASSGSAGGSASPRSVATSCSQRLDRRRPRCPARAPPRAPASAAARAAAARARRTPSATASAPRTGRTSPVSDSSPTTAHDSIASGSSWSRRDQQRDRERQVERRPDLAQVGRREVDRDPLQRELVARVHHRRPHPLARLAHGLVRQSDDRERGQAEPDVGLDPDPPGIDAVDRERDHAREHQNAASRWSRRTSVAVGVEQDGDAVEAQLGAVGAVGGLGEPRDRHPADLRLLAVVQALPRLARAGAARLDLDEDERLAVEGDEVELAEARPVVAGEDLEAEAFEVLGGELLAALCPRCAGRLSWPARRYGGPLYRSHATWLQKCAETVPIQPREHRGEARPVVVIMASWPDSKSTDVPARGIAQPLAKPAKLGASGPSVQRTYVRGNGALTLERQRLGPRRPVAAASTGPLAHAA